ncbi:guanine nucleotide-binding protein subunit beta-like protein 1 [Copidosoma floridanum]|uniref:guanine nucleotide-binding protein subunit beta-like protein 1 n=1 Tax=Copidosoma floridanum TaxID=29053 RepID=UPI0006C956F7|nr:guanine nucleotide-binding protein subunit beta-like protein 1 [Copidosoma floridanum]
MAAPPPDPVYVMKGTMGPVHCLLFRISPHYEHIYAGAESGSVHIWDLQKNRELLKLNSSEAPCHGIQIFGDENLVTQRKGGALNFWQAHDSRWEVTKTVKTNYYAFCRCQKSTENTMFIPLNNSKIGLFSLKTYETEIELDPLSFPDIDKLGDVMAMKPCLDGFNYVLVAYDIGKLLLWDIRSKKILSSLTLDACPMTIDFNTSVMSGVVGTPEDNLNVFSLSQDHKLSKKKVIPLKNPGTSIVTMRPDMRVFAAGGWDSRIRIFSWKTLKALAVLDTHKDTVYDIIYSTSRVEAYNSNCIMAAAGKDGTISLWSLYN